MSEQEVNTTPEQEVETTEEATEETPATTEETTAEGETAGEAADQEDQDGDEGGVAVGDDAPETPDAPQDAVVTPSPVSMSGQASQVGA